MGSHPDHDTLAAFRRRFLDEMAGIFVQVLELAQEMKLLKLGTISLDGTKVHANASRHSALSHGHIEKIEAHLKAEVQELLALAEQADRADVPDAVSLPAEIKRRRDRLAAMAEAKAKIEARAVTQATNDKEQVVPMLAQLAALPESLGKVGQLLADTGFFSGKNVLACEAAGIEALIAVARDEHHARWRDRFTEPAPLAGDGYTRRAHGAPAQDEGRPGPPMRSGSRRWSRYSASSNLSWASGSFFCAG